MDESAVAKEVLTWLQVSKEFVMEQAPLLAQEIIRWGMFSYALWMIFSLLLVLIGVVAAYKSWKRCLLSSSIGCNDGPVFCFSLSILWTAVFLVVSAANLAGLIQVLVAPRLYLLEQLTRMVR